MSLGLTYNSYKGFSKFRFFFMAIFFLSPLISKGSFQTKILKENVNLASSSSTGLVVGAATHPFDRGLYLALTKNRPIFDPKNFRKCWSGLSQAAALRTFSNSSYFALQGFMKDSVKHFLPKSFEKKEVASQVALGSLIGISYAFINNPLAAVRYAGLNEGNKYSFLQQAQFMWKKGKVTPFLRGLKATVLRDIVFGSVYEGVRSPAKKKLEEKLGEEVKPSAGFISNLLGAAPAAFLSAPFNFVRYQGYSQAPEEKSQEIGKKLKGIMKEVSGKPLVVKARYLKNRFLLGPTTALAVVGMAFGQSTFDFIKEKIVSLDSDLE